MSNHTSQENNKSKGARSAMHRGGPRHMGAIEKPKDARGALMRLVYYLSPHKITLGLVLIMVIGYTLLGLVGPYLTGVAIDNYIATKDAAGLGRTVALMMAVYVGYSLMQALSNWLMASISQKALHDLRRDLFEHIQKLSLSFFDRNPAGELMSRLTNDIEAINQAVSQNVTSAVASLLTMVGTLIAMFLLNFWLALASVITVPLIAWFATFIAKYTRRGFRQLQKDLGQLNGVMEETISGQRVVKAFRRGPSTIAKFRKHNEDVFKAGVYANTYAFLLMPITGQIGNLFVILLAGLGGYLAINGLTTVGMIATFIAYGRQFIHPVRELSNLYNSIQAALAGAERVFEIIDTRPELPDAENPSTLDHINGLVQFKDVDFGYLPDVPVIKDMSLEAAAGETIALVGPTGAGKTTIINLLTRFYDIQDGAISIDGVDIRQISKDELRRKLGLVLQDTFLFSDTVMENIRYGRLDATDEECIRAAEIADADHFIRQLPQGYQTNLSERGGNLSQGQRQLLTIARAVLADPSILILDEATSSVDTRTEARIQAALLRLMEGRTSFVIAHRLSTIRDADRVVVIDDGEIVEQGDHQQLMDAGGFYHKLYMSQFKGQAI